MTEETKNNGRGGGCLSRRAASRLAWSLWALTVSLTALSALLVVLSLSHSNAPVFGWWFGNTFIVIDASVGAIVASRRPENPVGWLLCLSGMAVGASTFISQYAIYALLARPGALPAGEAAAWIASWSLPVIIGLQVSYLTLFPTGRLPSRRWRPLAWLIVAVVVAGVISSAFASDPYMGSLGPIRNPLAVEGFSEVYEAVSSTTFPLLYVVAAASLFVRLRRATGVERQQLKWLAYAAAGFAIGVILVLLSGAMGAPGWFGRAANALFLVASEGIIVAIGIAILRYRLYEIDLIINRTLVYGTLTATLMVLYFGAIVMLQKVFVAFTGEKFTLAVVASTLAIAALFDPLRSPATQGASAGGPALLQEEVRRGQDARLLQLQVARGNRPGLSARRGARSDSGDDAVRARLAVWLHPHTADAEDDVPG